MATPRKHWFRVQDSIRREAWDNDVLAFAVRLMALLNDQWARDGITDREKACEISLSPAALADCAGCQSVARARSIARRLAADSTLTVHEHGTRTVLKWPKYAEIQWPDAPTSGSSREKASPSAPAPSDAPLGREELLPSGVDAAEPASPIDPLEKPLRLLKQERGSTEAKRAWLSQELPLLLAEAERVEPHDKRAQSAAFRGLIIRYWRQHEKPPQLRSANGIDAKGRSTSDLAERARAIVRERGFARATGADGGG